MEWNLFSESCTILLCYFLNSDFKRKEWSMKAKPKRAFQFEFGITSAAGLNSGYGDFRTRLHLRQI